MINKSPFLVALALICPSPPLRSAPIVRYWEDFEPPDAVSSKFSGSVQSRSLSNINQNPGGWRIGGFTTFTGRTHFSLMAGVDTLGVGGSQALFANWGYMGLDEREYAFFQYEASPLPGFPSGVSDSQVRVALDLFISGAEFSTAPIYVSYSTDDGGGYRSILPTLVNGQFTRVQFSLDEASGTPIDVTQSFTLSLYHFPFAFGVDNNNIVRIDNVSVTAVPEPFANFLGGVGIAMVLRVRRPEPLAHEKTAQFHQPFHRPLVVILEGYRGQRSRVQG